MTFPQALTVVRRSIKSITGAQNIDPAERLDALGIGDRDRRDLLKDTIRLSSINGVDFYKHTITSRDLSAVKTTDTVTQVASTVHAKATPLAS